MIPESNTHVQGEEKEGVCWFAYAGGDLHSRNQTHHTHAAKACWPLLHSFTSHCLPVPESLKGGPPAAPAAQRRSRDLRSERTRRTAQNSARPLITTGTDADATGRYRWAGCRL